MMIWGRGVSSALGIHNRFFDKSSNYSLPWCNVFLDRVVVQ